MSTDDTFDLNALWGSLLPRWASFARERVTLDRASPIGVPDAWRDLIDPSTRAQATNHYWKGLPRFCGYVDASLLDLRVYSGVLGPVLVYLLRAWREVDHDRFEPGLMLGGVPESAEAIDRFEARVGGLPDALRAAWHAHTFMLTKTGRWLASLRPEYAATFGAPGVYPGPVVGWVGDAQGSYDCLEILRPGADISGCLLRKQGERTWRDRIVYREGVGMLVDSHRQTLDDTLTDWERSDWQPA